MTTHQPIHILGAGIAGLTLSRCLATKGIPSILFDKGPSPAHHNYGITLHSWAYQSLLKTLDIDETAFRKRIAVDSLNGGNGRVSARIRKDANGSESSFRAHCGRFESLLREGADVRWKHTFQKISGKELLFNDGTKIQRSLTIDTCGVHSLTRKTMAAASQLNVLPYVVFRGTRKIPAQTFKDIYAPTFLDGNIIELKNHNILLQVEINDIKENGDVDVSYIYSRPARSNDPLHRPGREKDEAASITEEFYTEVAQLSGLESPFEEIFDAETMRGERILHWLMRSSLTERSELDRLLNEEIVVVGDSAHTLPVLGGNGANFAMRDAIGLAEALSEGVKEIGGFYEKQYEDWQDAVKNAEKRLGEMHGTGNGNEKSSL